MNIHHKKEETIGINNQQHPLHTIRYPQADVDKLDTNTKDNIYMHIIISIHEKNTFKVLYRHA